MKRAVLMLLAACGGGGGGDPVDATSGPDAPDSTQATLAGTFLVSLVPAATAGGQTTAAYSSLLGKVYDGAQPEAIVWETKASSGGCTLTTPRVPFCATPCGGTAVCVEDNTCKPYATAQTVGTVTAHGLATAAGTDTFAMDPVANTYQPPALAYPAFTEGEKFELVSSGSPFAPAFTVGTRGVAPLVLTTQSIALQRDTALALAWTAPAASGSSIHVKLDISHHGGSKGKLECDFPDAGSASIAATLLNQLLDLGAAGYPTIIITRSRTGSAEVPSGRVDLIAAATVEQAVTVPGVTSCTDTSQCPNGETCQSDLTCR